MCLLILSIKRFFDIGTPYPIIEAFGSMVLSESNPGYASFFVHLLTGVSAPLLLFQQ